MLHYCGSRRGAISHLHLACAAANAQRPGVWTAPEASQALRSVGNGPWKEGRAEMRVAIVLGLPILTGRFGLAFEGSSRMTLSRRHVLGALGSTMLMPVVAGDAFGAAKSPADAAFAKVAAR